MYCEELLNGGTMCEGYQAHIDFLTSSYDSLMWISFIGGTIVGGLITFLVLFLIKKWGKIK